MHHQKCTVVQSFQFVFHKAKKINGFVFIPAIRWGKTSKWMRDKSSSHNQMKWAINGSLFTDQKLDNFSCALTNQHWHFLWIPNECNFSPNNWKVRTHFFVGSFPQFLVVIALFLKPLLRWGLIWDLFKMLLRKIWDVGRIGDALWTHWGHFSQYFLSFFWAF